MLSLLALAAVTLKYRWFYVQTNLFREEEVGNIKALLQRAAKVGYNGMVLTDTKLQSQDPYPDSYQARVRQIKDEAKLLGIDVIPVVLPVGYADGMLAHDPNLVEAAPVKDALFVAKNGFAQIVADPAVKFANGDFEAFDGDTFRQFAFQDGAAKATFVDHETFHGGKTSLRIENPGKLTEIGGNCRVMQKAKVHPHRHYNFSAWVKTIDFAAAGSVRLLVLGGGKPLSFHDVPIERTGDWKRVDVTFDSGENEEVFLYLGVWGGTTGRLWFDDAKLEELGLMNVVRRPGCPISVMDEDGTRYQEGRDFKKIADPRSGTIPWPGEFEVIHASPPIKITDFSRIRNNARLRVSWYHAVTTESGKTALCLSELKSQKLEADEIKRVANLFGPDRLFFAHDEIRVMNQCEACRKRGITPGQILAEDIRTVNRLATQLAPKGERFIWSDMLDPFHNATADYYAVNGDLKGSWENLPKDLVIVNWNSGKPGQSLPFFDKLGRRQILAGYYDGPVDAIKGWLEKGKTLKGVVGVMYTTWANRYDDLEAFAKAAWGAGY